MGRQLKIAVIVIILAVIISVSIMAARLSNPSEVTGSAVDEMSQPQRFSARNTIFIVLLTITVISMVFTAKRISVYSQDIKENPEHSPELKEAVSRASTRNSINNFIKMSVEKELTEDEIVDALVSNGWPEDYTKNYVKYFLKTI